jgi:protein-tyrosine phosphatase
MKRGMFTPSKENIFSKVAELNTRLKPPCALPPALTILPGADNAFEPDILDQIEHETALFVAHPLNAINATTDINPSNAFRYILLELPDYFLLPQVKDLIRKLREKKIVPVLSHPERIAMIQRNYKLLSELIQAGALSQITAMSVTGEFGKEIKKLTRTLIKKNLVHVIATDTHSRERRPPILSRAVSEVADLIGSDKAELMVGGIPRAIIEGKEINIY